MISALFCVPWGSAKKYKTQFPPTIRSHTAREERQGNTGKHKKTGEQHVHMEISQVQESSGWLVISDWQLVWVVISLITSDREERTQIRYRRHDRAGLSLGESRLSWENLGQGDRSSSVNTRDKMHSGGGKACTKANSW